MSETSAKPVHCHKCGVDVSGVGFAYHIDRKIRCLECTRSPTNKQEGAADGR